MKVAVAGAAAIAAGVGLARFAYVPLFPAMVGAGWVDGAGAGLLGAANFAGYLLGVLAGRGLAARIGVPRALDAGMALALVAFAACAWQGGLAWLLVWRGLAGVAGGFLMALAGPAVQASVPPERRSTAGGIVMAGAGSGSSRRGCWCRRCCGAGCRWPGSGWRWRSRWSGCWRGRPGPTRRPCRAAETRRGGAGGLAAAGSPMGCRRRGWWRRWSTWRTWRCAAGACRSRPAPLAWIGFGAGAMAGTLLGGRVAGRIGGRRALPWWMAAQVVALGLALVPWWPALLLAGPLGGFAGVGATAVTLAAAREIAGVQAAVVWVRATAIYAVAQAASASRSPRCSARRATATPRCSASAWR